MTPTVNSTSQQPSSLAKRMIIGAAIGLLFISYFLISVDQPPASWGKFWMIQPLFMVPFAGAMGGLCNYFIMQYHERFGIHKVVAAIISVVVFLIGLWMGIVLGLNGTMWN